MRNLGYNGQNVDILRAVYVIMSLAEIFSIYCYIDDPTTTKPWCIAICGIIFLIQLIVFMGVGIKTDLSDVEAEAQLYFTMAVIGCAQSFGYLLF